MARAFQVRAIAYRETDRHESAFEDIDRAIELAPRDPSHRFHRGIIHAMSGNYDKAIADFSSSIDLDPSIPVSYTNRAIAYRAVGEFERAEADDAKAAALEDSPGREFAAMPGQQAGPIRKLH